MNSSEGDVHLYWNFRRSSSSLLDIASGIGLCGARNVPRRDLTVVPKDATCERCKIAFENQQKAKAQMGVSKNH